MSEYSPGKREERDYEAIAHATWDFLATYPGSFFGKKERGRRIGMTVKMAFDAFLFQTTR